MSTRKRRGLGQGLGALIPGGEGESVPPSPTDVGSGLREVPIDNILPNPYQPRGQMAEAQLAELATSIRAHGIIQPLIVTQMEEGATGGRYQLIAGERRWRAAKRVGLATVPVVVKEASERELLELALVENIQRADLNPIEEALAYQQMAEFGSLTHDEIGARVGKSRSTVSNKLRLLQLPEPILNMVRDGSLSEGQARPLLGLPSASIMMDAAKLFMARELTARQAEEWVKGYPHSAAARRTSPPPLSLHDRDLQKQFVSVLGTRVELRRRKKGGQIIIHFENDEDLQSIYHTIADE